MCWLKGRLRVECSGERNEKALSVVYHPAKYGWQTPYRYKTADDFSSIKLGKIPEDTQSQ